MKKFASSALSMVFALSVLAAEVAPDLLAREVTDKIVVLLKANKNVYTKDHKKLYAMVDEHVLPNFDFRAMSRTVLGRYWRTASEEQRTRFTAEFRDLLVRTYATALLKYNDEKIVYLAFRLNPDDRTTTVKSEVRRTDAGWKVYDVTIEGASLVTTYQSTYSARVQREGVNALIANLAQDNKAAAEGKTVSNGTKASSPK